MSNPYDTPSISFKSYLTPRGAVLAEPLILLDFDSLQMSQKFNPSLDFEVDVLGYALPGQPTTNTGPWRACNPGEWVSVLVDTDVSGCPYVSSSGDGATEVDVTCPGVINAGHLTCLRFKTTLSHYRLCFAPSEPGAVVVLSQPSPYGL
jgi:hypothetical protein